MKRRQKRRTGPGDVAVMGAVVLILSGLLTWGEDRGAYLVTTYVNYAGTLLGIIALMPAAGIAVGRRFGSRGALIGFGLVAAGMGVLGIWARFDNLGFIRDRGMEPQMGLWIALAGGVLLLAGGAWAVVAGSMPDLKGTREPAPETGTAGQAVPTRSGPRRVLPEEPEVAALWTPTHRTPAEVEIPALAVPDPSADVIAMLPPASRVEVRQRRGDWAKVVLQNGWWCWVDARKLEPDAQPAGISSTTAV